MMIQSSTEVHFKHEYSLSLCRYLDTKPSTTSGSGGFSADQDVRVCYTLKDSTSLSDS